MKEEALDRTLQRARFGIGYGPVVRQNYVVMIVVSTTEVMSSAIR